MSCQFNQSIHKDLKTGASYRGDGISCDNVIMEINDKRIQKNQFIYGEKIIFRFDNVKGLTKIDNKTYPQITIKITDDKNKTILSNDKLLDHKGFKLSPLTLTTAVIFAIPYQNNEKYKLSIIITDQKSKGKFTYKLPFSVSKSENLSIKKRDLTYEAIYLWDNTSKRVVTNNVLNHAHQYMFIMDKIHGLTEQNNTVFPLWRISLVDGNKQALIDSPNALIDYEKKGIPAKNITDDQIYYTLDFTNGILTNPYRFKSILQDKFSDKFIDISADFQVE